MKVREAVSIVLIASNKVFVIERQNYLASFPGYTAFPGGKVDNVDYNQKIRKFKNVKSHHLSAIVREAKEELGIDLIECANNISYMAKATSPDFNPRRFETFFYRVELKEQLDFTLDQGEFKNGDWYEANIVVDQWLEGKRLCVPPVRLILQELSKNINVTSVEFEQRYCLDTEVPHVETINGLWQVMPLSDTVPPADRTNCFVFDEIIIDPSPKDEDELKKFLNTIKKVNVKKIFLTHHHPDHHRNLPKLLEKLRCEVMLSEDTESRIKMKWGADYFQCASKITHLKEGDILGRWNNQDVICYEIPGHDKGQIGIAPKSLEWFVAGDLFQGIGTVVIGGEESCMKEYFSTLEKVIQLSPKCVIPSHGIPLGGTYILEKTLKHRKFREQQVLEMFQNGLTIDEILGKIYFDIPKVLYKYARANIESHLKKLELDGVIKNLDL